MLWSSVQLMASAIASTPRQLTAVSCFSGDAIRRKIRNPRKEKETKRLIETNITGLSLRSLRRTPKKKPEKK